MEGVAYAQRHCLDALEETGVVLRELLITGGGGTSALWRQMLADLFGRPVATVRNQGGAALGAALLAGVGTGVYPHHGAVAFGHIGKELFAALSYLGVDNIDFNRPKCLRYPQENPFA